MVLTISVAVIAAVVVIAVCFQIWVGLQIRRTALEAEKLMEIFRPQILPLAGDLAVISREVKEILGSIRRQVEHVEEGVASVKDAAAELRKFQRGIQERIESPLLEFAALAGAVSQGIQAFFRIFHR